MPPHSAPCAPLFSVTAKYRMHRAPVPTPMEDPIPGEEPGPEPVPHQDPTAIDDPISHQNPSHIPHGEPPPARVHA